LSFSLLITAALGCAGAAKSGDREAAAKKSAVTAAALTLEEATQRAAEVSDVHYRLWFGMDTDRTEFDGRTEISFQFLPRAGQSELSLDFEAGAIRSLTVNGRAASAAEVATMFDSHRIHFKASELEKGSNQVAVEYSHPYSTDGDGFYRFRDPED